MQYVRGRRRIAGCDPQGLFLYLVLKRAKPNLALARHNLRRIEADLTI